MLFRNRPNLTNSPTVSLHTDTHEPPSRFLGELQRLLFFGLALILLLSLVSYTPRDPSWSTWTTKQVVVTNWLGRVGSTLSDFLLQAFGLACYYLILQCDIFAYFSTREEANSVPITRRNILLSVALLLLLANLFQCLLPFSWMPWQLPNPGGVVGRALATGSVYLFGQVGTVVISFLLLLTVCIFLFQRELFTQLGILIWRAPARALTLMKLLVKNSPLLFVRLKPFWGQCSDKLFTKWQAWRNSRQSEESLPVESEKESGELQQQGEAASPTLSPLQTIVPDEDIESLTRSNRVKSRPKQSKALNKGAFELPHLNMLSGKAENKVKTVDKSWYLEKSDILVQKLKDFGVDGEVVNISPGPVITVYEFKPASGVKIKEISNLSDDLTLALSVLSVRIVAPIPGKPVVGIEIPSPYREMVYFKDMIQETPFFKGDIRIPIVLGRLASGEPIAADLASMPHLLVAGTTGTGKSVFINTLICSLIYRFTPHQLKLILVDPKMVELSHYEGIPHLLLPVVVDSKKAVVALRWVVQEMERRYTKMHQAGVRHIDAYNEKLSEVAQTEGDAFLPYIVVVIDEYADLMAVVPKDVELSIARLAQKARASGIHLVLATQRPSTDVVTGTIKANFPSRISFRVASSVDSKTILDRTGADRLLGHGDMLFHSAGFTTLKRMQGAFISDLDIEKVVAHLKAQGEPQYDQNILQETEELADENWESSNNDVSSDNQLYDMAVRIVTERGEASISLIQRHLRIGYNRAASLMEQLEAEGVVAQQPGSGKRRAVLAGPQ